MRLIGAPRSWLSLSALLLAGAGVCQGEREHLRYERSIPGTDAGARCAVLDAAVFAHATGSLRDVRLMSGSRELAYAIAVNGTAQVESEPATVLNLRESKRGADFDLAMPARAYTQLILQLEGKDFVAEATLTGGDQVGSSHAVALGSYNVFDLTSRKLSRDTTISLQESSLRYLHVTLRGEGFRVKGVNVPPSREGQTLFTEVAETQALQQRGNETIATLRLPARVPVERVGFRLDPTFTGNFSRRVLVTATADSPGSLGEHVIGTIFRVHTGTISVDEEALPASLGANLQTDATVEVAIDNDGQRPLPISTIALSMRQRTICFDAPGPVDLFYGDPLETAPLVRYEPVGRWKLARLGPERLNPSFRKRRGPLGWEARHPRRMRAGVPGVVLALVLMALAFWGKRRFSMRRNR